MVLILFFFIVIGAGIALTSGVALVVEWNEPPNTIAKRWIYGRDFLIGVVIVLVAIYIFGNYI